MADGKIKISELTSALQISDTAKFPYSQDNSGTETTYGAEITQIARKIAEGIDLTNLQTTAKTLVGAINEINAGGGGGGGTAVVLYGTSAPTSAQGSNGNLYVQYTAGTGGADDTVDALFVKLDGAWCEIATGGGGGGDVVRFDINASHTVNPTHYDIVVSVGETEVYTHSYSCTVFGVFSETTDTFTYDNVIYTITAQGYNASQGQKMLDVSINGTEESVYCSATNSSYPCDDDFFITISEDLGGHTIVDDSGTSLTQRPKLQFKGAYSEDNSTDSTTEVNVIRSMTKAEFDLLSNTEKQGLINVTDEISGGLKYVKTTLFENVDEDNLTVLNNGDTISLSDNILDYDEIYFEGCFYESGNATGKKLTHLAVTKVMRDTIAFAKSKYGTGQYEGMFDVAHNFIVSSQTYCFMYCLKVPTDSSFYLAFKYVNGWNGSSCTLTRIIGIKYLSDSVHTYSEDEQIVGTWIDGSTLYEKTISTSNSTVDLTSLNIDDLVKIEGTILHTNGKITPVSYGGSPSDFAVPVYDTSSKILSLAGYGTSQGGTWTFTIRYTKAST